MIRLGFVLPDPLDAPTGGTRYDREILHRLPAFAVEAIHCGVSAHYPFPSPSERNDTAHRLRRTACDLWLIDGLAFGAFDATEMAALTAPVIVLLHHPLADETGLSAEQAQLLYASEKANLRHVRAIIVTSQATKHRLITHYDVKEQTISIAEPAVQIHTVLSPKPPMSADRPARLLAVGAISPRKNYGLLLEALRGLNAAQNWELHVVGRLDDQTETAKLKRMAQDFGLAPHCVWHGAVSEQTLASLYQESDFLLYPSLYEGYGMALDEALAAGLPVLASALIPSAHRHAPPAVLRLDPTSPQAWQKAITHWLDDPKDFTNACQAAREASRSLTSWDEPARLIAHCVKQALTVSEGMP